MAAGSSVGRHDLRINHSALTRQGRELVRIQCRRRLRLEQFNMCLGYGARSLSQFHVGIEARPHSPASDLEDALALRLGTLRDIGQLLVAIQVDISPREGAAQCQPRAGDVQSRGGGSRAGLFE